jgi:hypothetical protein
MLTPAHPKAIAIHVCADRARRGPDKWWTPLASFADSVQRASAICDRAGIVEQRTLAGEQASCAAVLGALDDAGARLDDGGLLVLMFAGHCERGDGPIETARWCLADGGLEIAALAAQLAQLPTQTCVVIIADTCYAAAIAAVFTGPQPVLLLASCGEDQTTVARRSSDLMVRLEQFWFAADGPGSVTELRDTLEADTPDCERPVVWTNRRAWWAARPFDIAIR